jgi:hypothetical protein
LKLTHSEEGKVTVKSKMEAAAAMNSMQPIALVQLHGKELLIE